MIYRLKFSDIENNIFDISIQYAHVIYELKYASKTNYSLGHR